MKNNNLKWEEKYSVGVKLIDDQHKHLIETINLLISVLASNPSKEKLDEIITRLMEYKKYHFATEEKFFIEFDYEDKEDHSIKHREFNTSMEKLISDSNGDTMILAFGLVDFLENWMIDHLLVEDQKYVSCFKDHGLK